MDLYSTPAGRATEHNPFNTLRPRQNGHHFPDDIFKCNFVKGSAWISIRFSHKLVPKVRIDNKGIIWTIGG